MKKFFLFLFILVDLAVVAASVLFLISRIKGTPLPGQLHLPASLTPATPAPARPGAAIPASGAAPATSTTTAATAATGNPALPKPAATTIRTNTRKILFSYKNSKAQRVMIRGDFTGWRAEPMKKEAGSTWTYTSVLEPGDYGYLYSVDDKPKLDPANKHTKLVGKTTVSAILVKPPAATPSAPH
jgi:hypothetical protein